MLYKKGLVSIVIPCYNGERYIDRCLMALLRQKYTKIQAIVVDDGSTDDTLNLLNAYVDQFSQANMELIVLHQDNKGQAAAINSALDKVEGEYLCWQDIDDLYPENAIGDMVKYLDDNHANFMRGEVAFYNDENLNKMVKHGKSVSPGNRNIFENYIYQDDCYSFVGIFMVKMELFDKCIPNRKIYESRAGQNWQLILPLAYHSECIYLDKIIYHQIIVKNSHSRQKYNNYTQAIKRINAVEDVLSNTLKRLGVFKKYESFIKNFYLRQKLHQAFAFDERDGYNEYKSKVDKSCLTNRERIMSIIINNRVLNRLYRTVRKG